MKRVALWTGLVALLLVLLLPMPLAERFTSPTQDGQFLTHPIRAYQFVIAAAKVSDSAVLGRSGQALERARRLFSDSGYEVAKVELLFFSSPRDYEFITLAGGRLRASVSGPFVWEVWARARSGEAGSDARTESDVIALLDFQTGDVLASLVPTD